MLPLEVTPNVHSVALLFGVALLARFAIGLHGYSGQGKAPMYGDYEAQRHWMEVTLHTPLEEWYVNTPTNNLSYWGLDYPPLSAYQSYVYGKVLSTLEPEAFALSTSQGYESPTSKMLMRWSVVVSDLVFTFPASLAVIQAFHRGSSAGVQAQALIAMLLQPAALLIDHGHFQFNNIGLGLSAAAAAAVALDWDCLGSALFCMALNHKQMALYFAPAFFAHLLGKSLQRQGTLSIVMAVVKLGVVVLSTFALIWWPFLRDPQTAVQVLQRLVPVQRGIFEDYVANFWCVTHIIVKWKTLFTKTVLWRLCTGATLMAFLPSIIQQIWRPSREGFLMCMANSSIAFFLFSYQVHEKSCLLFLLPVTMMGGLEPYLAAGLPIVGAFSMVPLLVKDDLLIAYYGITLLYFCVHYRELFQAERWILRITSMTVSTVMAGVHVCAHFLPSPSRYPYFYDLLYVSVSFLCFLLAAFYLNVRQLQMSGGIIASRKRLDSKIA